MTITTVFPRIVSAETIVFWKLKCGNYSKEETIQGRKLFFFVNFYNLNIAFFQLGNYRKFE